MTPTNAGRGHRHTLALSNKIITYLRGAGHQLGEAIENDLDDLIYAEVHAWQTTDGQPSTRPAPDESRPDTLTVDYVVAHIRSATRVVTNDGLGRSYLIERHLPRRRVAEVTRQMREAQRLGLARWDGLTWQPITPAPAQPAATVE